MTYVGKNVLVCLFLVRIYDYYTFFEREKKSYTLKIKILYMSFIVFFIFQIIFEKKNILTEIKTPTYQGTRGKKYQPMSKMFIFGS